MHKNKHVPNYHKKRNAPNKHVPNYHKKSVSEVFVIKLDKAKMRI